MISKINSFLFCNRLNCLKSTEVRYIINMLPQVVCCAHMWEMGIQAVYTRENTSKPNPANLIYPYLLKGVNINHPNHVWSIDLTYIPIRSSWLYLVAIIDWYSQYVLDWMLDDTMDIGFVLETSRNAFEKATPEIMNSD